MRESRPSHMTAAIVTSPDGRLRLEVAPFDRDLGRGVFHKPERALIGYRVWLDDKPVTEQAAIGLTIGAGPQLLTGLRVTGVTSHQAEETYRPAYGEHAEHPAAYTQATIELTEDRDRPTARRFTLRVRVYDGVGPNSFNGSPKPASTLCGCHLTLTPPLVHS